MTSITKSADSDPDLPRYDVTVDGVTVGTVFRAWWRTGGTGWGNSARGSLYRVGDTRAAAVADLLRRTSVTA